MQRQQRVFLHGSEHATLDPKNVLALRTLFAIAHRLALLLGESWLLVLGTVNCLDRILSTPRQATQVCGRSHLRSWRPLMSLHSTMLAMALQCSKKTTRTHLLALHCISACEGFL